MAERIFVALDLETTGLNANKDTIIEIGAVRYQGDQILDRFSTLVNPQRPIPLFIQQLTGITNRDVANAPTLEKILPELLAFVDRDVFGLVAHNAAFDIGFLRAAGANFHRPVFDTFELATILMPGIPSYSLGELASTVGITLTDAHRAPDDALATARLFMHLLGQIRALPPATVQEILRRGDGADWAPLLLFEDALAQVAPDGSYWPGGQSQLDGQSAPSDLGIQKPLDATVSGEEERISEADVTAIFAPDGPLARQMGKDYETRTGQIEMANLVTDAFNRGDHRLIEAGTGTGKSLGYLVPAALWALTNNLRVVIATNTIALQDQLMSKEIPQIRQALLDAGIGKAEQLRAGVLKGRSHYLCSRRFHNWYTSHRLSPLELRVLTKVLVWLPATQTGDVSELALRDPAEWAIWNQIASDPWGCSPDRCSVNEPLGSVRDFFWEARQRAESVHLLIVNHALLLADIATGGRVLPPYDHLIIDEAHRLEEAATNQLTYRVSQQTIDALLSQLYLNGDLADLLNQNPAWGESVAELRALSRQAGQRLAEFIQSIVAFAKSQKDIRANANYSQRLSLDSRIRAQPRWSQIEVEWEHASRPLRQATSALKLLVEKLAQARWRERDPQAGYLVDLQGLQERLSELVRQMDAIIYEPVSTRRDTITWLETNPGTNDLSLCSAPLHVNELLAEELFKPRRTVVLTGATLRTGDGFRFMRDRLGAWNTTVTTIESPFDYKANALLYLPSDMPTPDRPGYQQAVEQAIVEAARGAQGRTLALFTSYGQLRVTAEAIRAPLRELGITLLQQGNGGRHRLLQEFRTTAKAVLLGTGTFWEGIDLPGDVLSCLLIVRLPFAVPNDPLYAARSTLYDDAFNDYAVPDAVLRFRQGFGRLIRRATDRGVIVILDSRVWHKSYGEAFLDALPSCATRHGPLVNLGETVQQWLANEAWFVT
jgi:DNA polymerase-3 subunit epsilon/ATP-dependent DNA helicase DinG